MNTIATSEFKSPSIKSTFVVLVACCVLFVGSMATKANEPLPNLIRSQANELNCVADQLQDEIKVHFRGTRGYGKLLGFNAKIKARSAAVDRRICRDPYYRTLDNDVEKLNELACELQAAYDDALAKSFARIGKPVVGDTCHVVAKIANVARLADGMKAASYGLVASYGVVPGGLGQEINHVSEFNPNIDVAPGVPPVNNLNQFQFPARRPNELELNEPVDSSQRPVSRSVLIK